MVNLACSMRSALDRVHRLLSFMSHPASFRTVRDPLPAVYLATRLAHGETPREVFDHIIGEEFTPGVDAIVEELPPGWTQAATPGSPGERVLGAGATIWRTWTPNRSA